jgi:hypothetical protein
MASTTTEERKRAVLSQSNQRVDGIRRADDVAISVAVYVAGQQMHYIHD